MSPDAQRRPRTTWLPVELALLRSSEKGICGDQHKYFRIKAPDAIMGSLLLGELLQLVDFADELVHELVLPLKVCPLQGLFPPIVTYCASIRSDS